MQRNSKLELRGSEQVDTGREEGKGMLEDAYQTNKVEKATRLSRPQCPAYLLFRLVPTSCY